MTTKAVRYSIFRASFARKRLDRAQQRDRRIAAPPAADVAIGVGHGDRDGANLEG